MAAAEVAVVATDVRPDRARQAPSNRRSAAYRAATALRFPRGLRTPWDECAGPSSDPRVALIRRAADCRRPCKRLSRLQRTAGRTAGNTSFDKTKLVRDG